MCCVPSCFTYFPFNCSWIAIKLSLSARQSSQTSLNGKPTSSFTGDMLACSSLYVSILMTTSWHAWKQYIFSSRFLSKLLLNLVGSSYKFLSRSWISISETYASLTLSSIFTRSGKSHFKISPDSCTRSQTKFTSYLQSVDHNSGLMVWGGWVGDYDVAVYTSVFWWGLGSRGWRH